MKKHSLIFSTVIFRIFPVLISSNIFPMRKQFFTLTGLLFAASSFAQDDQFRMLNRSEITTGILHDKVYSWSDPVKYNGVNDTVSSYDNWRQMYYEMYNSALSTPRFPSIEKVEKKAFNFFDSTNAIPLLIAHFRYNKIKSYALDSNLLSFDGNMFHDVAGRKESPYEQHRLFAAGITIQEFDGKVINFYIGQQFLLTNVSEQPSAIEVDFGDENGFRTVGWNTFHTINYSAVSDKIIKIQLQFSSGKFSASTILSADPCGFVPSWCTMIQPDLPPWVPPPPIKFPFKIQAGIDYPVGSGQKAKGNAYLRYGAGPPVLDKVFIFVEGIDFGGINDANEEDFVQIYPNPSSREVIIKMKKYQINNIEITNILGKSIIDKKIDKRHEEKITINNLPDGIYFLKIVISNNNIFYTKFIKTN